MVEIKNKTFSPLQITTRTKDQSTLESVVLVGRGSLTLEEESMTPMIEVMEDRGLISTRIVEGQ